MCDFDFTSIDAIIEKFGMSQRSIYSILRAVQDKYNYLPKDIFPYISEKIGIDETNIYDIARNYGGFYLEPRGKYVIKVCDGTRCHVRSSQDILNALREELCLSDIKSTTDDLLFTVEAVYCLGACGLAPTISVNDKLYPSMSPEKAIDLIKTLKISI